MKVLRRTEVKIDDIDIQGDEDEISTIPHEHSGEVKKCCLISRRKLRCQKKPPINSLKHVCGMKSVPLLLALNIKSSSFFLSFPE